ncbi:MAG: phenylalanine 4-monooxygenase [Gammaproteobacteria bacterium]
MNKQSTYVAKSPDATGTIHYTDKENQTWQELYARQRNIVKGRACKEFLDGLELLQLPEDRIPQCEEVSARLGELTGWSVVPVPALIDYVTFFGLLAEKKFPAASFIRRPEELEYLQEPDIFHEIFGHTPMLTDPRFADFTHAYGRAGATADTKDHAILSRLYWFTMEFGLVDTADGLRTYGAGINSSIGETQYALESDVPVRKLFDAVEALRTPYRVDIFQTVYYVIESFEQVYELAGKNLLDLVADARELGMLEPTFPSEEESPMYTC